MKNVLLLLSVVFSSLFSTVSLAQTAKSISKDDALAIAQKQFVGKDVDYYILSNSTSAVWNIFVDAEPMKGWQHNCNAEHISGELIWNTININCK